MLRPLKIGALSLPVKANSHEPARHRVVALTSLLTLGNLLMYKRFTSQRTYQDMTQQTHQTRTYDWYWRGSVSEVVVFEESRTRA